MSDDAHDHDAPVNETEAHLSEILFGDEDSVAGELADSIDDLFCSHYSIDQIVAALAHALVLKHVDAHTSLKGDICQGCLSVGTTELLQTIRKWVDDCVRIRLSPEPEGEHEPENPK